MIRSLGVWLSTGDSKAALAAFRSLSESLVISTPYIFAGLGVALGFRGGLFNIGAEGQLFVAALASVFVGYSIRGLPWFVHLPLAILAGVLAAALWGAVPGFLKARYGAHEVINTIMMNYIAFRLTDYLLAGPMQRPGGLPITYEVQPIAQLRALFSTTVRLHWGFFLANDDPVTGEEVGKVTLNDAIKPAKFPRPSLLIDDRGFPVGVPLYLVGPECLG